MFLWFYASEIAINIYICHRNEAFIIEVCMLFENGIDLSKKIQFKTYWEWYFIIFYSVFKIFFEVKNAITY